MPTNPLRDPRDRARPRGPEPCALVVFGITGDLARKKLLPAVYDLANRGLLPTNFALLGFARRDWGATEVAALARESARHHATPRRGPPPAATGATPNSPSWPVSPRASTLARRGARRCGSGWRAASVS